MDGEGDVVVPSFYSDTLDNARRAQYLRLPAHETTRRRQPPSNVAVQQDHSARDELLRQIHELELYVSTLLDSRDHFFETKTFGEHLMELEIRIAQSCLELARVNADAASKMLVVGDSQGASIFLLRARSLLQHCGTPQRANNEINDELFVAGMLSEDEAQALSSPSIQTAPTASPAASETLIQAAALHRRANYLYTSTADDPYGVRRLLQLQHHVIQADFRSTAALVASVNRRYEVCVSDGQFLFARTAMERGQLPPGWIATPKPPPPSKRNSAPRTHRIVTPTRDTTATKIIISQDAREECTPEVVEQSQLPRFYLPVHRTKVPTMPLITAAGPDKCAFGHGSARTKRRATNPLDDNHEEVDSELEECGMMSEEGIAAEQLRAELRARVARANQSKSPSRRRGASSPSRGASPHHSAMSSPAGSPRNRSKASPSGSPNASFRSSGPPPLRETPITTSNPFLSLAERGAPSNPPSNASSASKTPVRSGSHSATKKASTKAPRPRAQPLVDPDKVDSNAFPVFLGTLATLDSFGGKLRRSKLPPQRRRGLAKNRSVLLSPKLSDRERKRIIVKAVTSIQQWYRSQMWWVASRDALVTLRFERKRARQLIIRCMVGFQNRRHLATTFRRDLAVIRLQYAFRRHQAGKVLRARQIARDRLIVSRERNEGLMERIVERMGNLYRAEERIDYVRKLRDDELESRIAREAADVDDDLLCEEVTCTAACKRVELRCSQAMSRIFAADPNLYHAPSQRAAEEASAKHRRVLQLQKSDEAAILEERTWAQRIISQYYRRHQCRAELQRRKTEIQFNELLRCHAAIESDMVTPAMIEGGRLADTLFSVLRDYRAITSNIDMYSDKPCERVE